MNKRDVKDRSDQDLTQEPEMIKAFRDTWELGIHSYLTYLRDRLILARELLTESGSVFVQISDENLHHVRQLLAEVFGADNFVSIVSFSKTSGFASSSLANVSDYLVWFCKSRDNLKFNRLVSEKVPGDVGATQYGLAENPETLEVSSVNAPRVTEYWDVLTHGDLTSQGGNEDSSFALAAMGLRHEIPANSHWKTPETGLRRLLKANDYCR